jgi:hypothetical protein
VIIWTWATDLSLELPPTPVLGVLLSDHVRSTSGRRPSTEAYGYTLLIFTFPGEPLMRVKFDYLEIIAAKKLTWIHSFVDAQGNVIRHPFNAGWPLQTQITVTFDHALAEQTHVTLTWTPVGAREEEHEAFASGIASMQTVWEVNFQQLTDLIAHDVDRWISQ